MRDEPLYELSVHFDNLTDDGTQMLINWIVNASETGHLTYWISKQEQQDEDAPEEVSGDE